jgi:hypothetical protein
VSNSELEQDIFGEWMPWKLNAFVGEPRGSFERYAVGYLKAGKLIMDWLEKNQRDQDYLVYPLAFLFRHYIELRLKEINASAGRLLDDQQEMQMNHEILPLWNTAKTKLKLIDVGDSTAMEKQIERVVSAYAQIDRLSFAFRYPVNKKLKPSLERKNLINIKRFGDATVELSEMLEAISLAISVMNDQKNEYMQLEREIEKEIDDSDRCF